MIVPVNEYIEKMTNPLEFLILQAGVLLAIVTLEPGA